MRRGSQREAAPGVTVVAASPDTPRRERWLWQASVVEGVDEVPGVPAGATVATLPLGRSVYGLDRAVLHVAADAEHAIPSVDRVDLAATRTVTRREDEVSVLLVDDGEVVVEGRHHLRPGDVLVLEGDDPLTFTVAAEREKSALAMARLAAPSGRLIGWVP